MATTLVSLVSNQTIPNVLAICHFRPEKLLFLTTPKMREGKKVEAIESAIQLWDENYRFERHADIEVDENSVSSVAQALDKLSLDESDSLIVNLTCGTKIMAIATYEFFRSKYKNARFVYLPISENKIDTIFPMDQVPVEIIKIRLNLKCYLAAYSLEVKNYEKLNKLKKEASARQDLTRWLSAQYIELEEVMKYFGSELRNHRDDSNGFNFDKSIDEKILRSVKVKELLLKRMEFKRSASKISKKLEKHEVQYLTGGWLEEFCYIELEKALKNSEGVDLALNPEVKSRNSGSLNEFDVMFTKENTLYLFECKSLDPESCKHNDFLYKITALRDLMGSDARAYLLTTAKSALEKDGKTKNSLVNRAKQLNAKIINPGKFTHFIDEISSDLQPQTRES